MSDFQSEERVALASRYQWLDARDFRKKWLKDPGKRLMRGPRFFIP
jgi:hypothetical protein